MSNYDAIATRVMRGDFGNGQDRKNRLKAQGYTPAQITAIQQRVNQMFYGAPVPAAAAPAPAAPAPAPAAPVVQIVEAVPPQPPEPPASPTHDGIKAAPIDTVVFVDEPFDENFFADVLFEDFGGQELLSIARSDTVNGQAVSYQPFRDLGIIQNLYSPNNLLSIQETSDKFFANFLIRLNEKIPVVGFGPNGSTIYFNSETGNGTIDFVNIAPDEQVEIQILNAGIIEDIGA